MQLPGFAKTCRAEQEQEQECYLLYSLHNEKIYKTNKNDVEDEAVVMRFRGNRSRYSADQ